jgi:DNA (cytosine-5)-methyltransferase 1
MTAYYNENDPYAAQWLRNLIAAGHIAPGDVDARSIVDVKADDLEGYEQAHFFAGIGGWSHALRLAGWPDDRSVWTGSCPCQPLSCAGQRKGHADERHLWPAFHDIIAKCGPAIVFGEQVAGADGREWFAGVRADLEALGYACGAADLCAAGVGADHIRQRIYWLAHAYGPRPNERPSGRKQSLRDMGAKDFWRENKPGPNPVADGVSCRMDRVRGGGQAIVPQVASEFIGAFMECQP